MFVKLWHKHLFQTFNVKYLDSKQSPLTTPFINYLWQHLKFSMNAKIHYRIMRASDKNSKVFILKSFLFKKLEEEMRCLKTINLLQKLSKFFCRNTSEDFISFSFRFTSFLKLSLLSQFLLQITWTDCLQACTWLKSDLLNNKQGMSFYFRCLEKIIWNSFNPKCAKSLLLMATTTLL